MSLVTLDEIETQQTKLAAMIAELKASVPKLLALRAAQIELRPGERYAGLVLDADGLASHHLILLPGEAEDLSWQASMAWASEAGGDLPSRREQALLFANLKGQFKPAWYWSNQQHETDGSCAWTQFFGYGGQTSATRALRAEPEPSAD